MLDRMPPVVGRIDSEGKLTEADQRLEELNRRAGGAIGEPLAVPELARLVRLAMRLGIALSRQVVVGEDEAELELWASVEPADGGVTLELGGWTEIRDWSSVAAATRDADFAAMAGDWHWETDASLHITRLTAGAGKPEGFQPEAMLGHPLTDLFRLSDDPEHGFPILAAVTSGEEFAGQRAEIRANGRAVYLSAVTRTDGSGRFSGLVGAAELVEDADKKAAQSSEGAAFPVDFGRRLDKALRDPLSRIIANADSIHAQTEGPLRDDYASYAADIASAGRHLLGLVSDLEDLQLVEREDFEISPEAIDLADIARRAAGLLGVRASQGDVRIDRLSERETMPATGEFRRALQVLVNLIGNAVRYSPKGGTVWLRLEREGDMACVIVADQGKGIAPENHERIFGKFERLDPGETEGSGLGLYISRQLARAMGGDITVDSAPGEGARFILMLPARD
ncbi:sensor histidine kinase [Stakelama marina]|uniref:histidine kinase n=1 Tax=Stakelama marina TaxID=2826939 RepID=A0A8T4IEG2_9SPHN|nr:HAMP domain-containing sensor histidine kinase [Stakelama marina]MBR0551385.1 HAMP domain-containing histidine kinase [Stakelama marina]